METIKIIACHFGQLSGGGYLAPHGVHRMANREPDLFSKVNGQQGT